MVAITGQILSLLPHHFPQKQSTLSKRALKTLRARALGHIDQNVDESPMCEDDCNVS